MVLKKGFTLIEIMIVILIIGLISAFGIPRFLSSPVPVAQTFIHKLNMLVSDAVEQAQEKSEARKVFFDFTARSVEVQSIDGKKTGGLVSLPETIDVTDVIINGVSQFQIGGGRKRTVYFLINHEGISQEVQLILQEKLRSGRSVSYEFYLHPFTNLFRVQ